ncbi:PROTEIN PHOSPHATASE 2C 60 ISOFORM X1-RELATED [Salix purpurea]|uniref:PROTEIN PHOSPHATASE 2C 60 ISOFORM X1-RELATED n=1 Tax=Salix purpurea TaxID=77065 RepID=A0A9Q0ZN15_SALPP|nr:PROTEIN PHOSPHATASE 2C 60 ISOFORM X1-RELATED [Salix purpurea]
MIVRKELMQPNSTCSELRLSGGKVVAKFCSKFLHQQVLKNEEYAAGDIGTSVQKAFFRMDEMMRGQRGVVVVMNNLMIGRFKRVLTLTSLDQLVVAQPVLTGQRLFKSCKGYSVGIEIPQNALKEHNISSNLSTSHPLEISMSDF